jgi:hypothetical protein
MGETFELVLRIVLILGIAAFMWSVSSSMERIAEALSRLADHDRKERAPEALDRAGGA